MRFSDPDRCQGGSGSGHSAASVLGAVPCGWTTHHFGLDELTSCPGEGSGQMRASGRVRHERRWACQMAELTLAFHPDAELTGASTVKGAPELGR